MATKTCLRCGETKDASQFGPGSKTPDGLNGSCRECIKAYRREWRRNVRENGTKRSQLLSTVDSDSNPVGEWITGETRGRDDCGVEGCPNGHFSMRLCRPHYYLARSLGNLPPRPEMVECKDCGTVIIVPFTGPVPVLCRSCRKAANRRVDPRKPYKHRMRVLVRYGMSISDYEEMLEEQGGLCAICGGPPDVGNGKKHGHLSIDHDHETNAVRGLLCHHCNLLLGHARDSVNTLQNAIRYLESA